jgi:hypothetical protein
MAQFQLGRKLKKKHHGTDSESPTHTPLSSKTLHSSPAELSSHDIIELQRTIGNQKVIQLFRNQGDTIAREGDAPTETATGLLSALQVQSAINYYTAQPERYTKSIIEQIQVEVGTFPNGKMAAVDVQAVAKRQQEMNDAGEKPTLKVDGMAGPRTLPAIFKIGLAQDDSLNSYTEKAKDLLSNRGSKTDEEIAIELAEKVNSELEAKKIPPLKIDTKEQIGGRGAFRNTEWKLLLDPRQFTDPKLRNMQETTATIYHEARHAEQYYRIAQMLGGRGYSGKRIHAETGIEIEVAKEAARPENHLKRGTMEAVIAEGWHDSLIIAEGVERIQKNNAAMDKAFAARKAAREAFDADPSPENRAKKEAAEAAYDKTVDEHDDLPHEFDAERMEDKVKKRVGNVQ